MAKTRSSGGLIFTLIVVLGATAGGWYYFAGRADKQPEYSTVKITRGNITQTISATGNLQTTSQVTISSQVSGNVIAINADFNDIVKKGQWLLKIDPSTYQQRLRQATADLAAAKANAIKTRGDYARSKDLFAKNLISQSDYDTAEATLAQAESNLVSKQAALETSQTDLDRCVIYSPIDGVILNRTIDVGATVNVNQSAVPLYTIINDLTKLQISADVSEADIGNVQEKQIARFSVDAYLNRPFQGVVSQVRNFAKNTSGVVTFSVIIDVDNSNLLLKPGMTATANIIVAERPNVLTVANNALRVRVPAELLPKTPAAPTTTPAGTKAGSAMSDDERRTAMREIMTAVGFQRGTPATPDMIEKAKKLATDKGLDPDMIVRMLSRGSGGGGGGRDGGPGASTGAGMNVSTQPRTLYKLVTDEKGRKSPEPVIVHLGISDGAVTQALDGVVEGDTLITYVTMPGAAASAVSGPPGQTGNPFQQNQRGGPGGGFGGGRGF